MATKTTCPHCKRKHAHHALCGHAPNRVWDPSRGEYVHDTGRSVTTDQGVHRRVTPTARMSKSEKILLGICTADGCHRQATRGDYCPVHARDD